MVLLNDVEQPLALFAEGIAGKYLHIKSVEEFDRPRLTLNTETAHLAVETLYLPEQIKIHERSAYRVLVLQQLGQREFGTYQFRMNQLQTVASQPMGDCEPSMLSNRTGDFDLFFSHFSYRALITKLFALFERARIDARILGQYPGMQRHFNNYNTHLNDLWMEDGAGQVNDALSLIDACAAAQRGMPIEFLRSMDQTDLLPRVHGIMLQCESLQASVFDSALNANACYRLLAEHYAWQTFEEIDLDDEAAAADWLQRHARLEDWKEELEQMDATLMAVEMLESDDAQVVNSEIDEGVIRPADTDIKAMETERDVLNRRIDMERSAIGDALGDEKKQARSFRYDEWDYTRHQYLPRWCRLFEERLEPDTDADLQQLKNVIQQWRHQIKQRLEHIKPLGYQRIRGVVDGDELDFNAVMDARQDIRAGISPSEQIYTRKEKIQRDLCVSFLVDLSASTDDPIEKPEPVEYQDDDNAPINLRDPYTDDDDDPYALLDEINDEPPPRRIIDVQKESMLVMAAALETLGDNYSINGFSGYGKDCAEIFVVKDNKEAFSMKTLQTIAAMKPMRSTRMGPAIRHATFRLCQTGHAQRLLIIVSDGFPQDCDYGPERGEHEYGLQDTARALVEAQVKGVDTFCVTVDRSGHDYLKRMCPDARYMVIEEIEDLPAALTKVYETLTG